VVVGCLWLFSLPVADSSRFRFLRVGGDFGVTETIQAMAVRLL
jgi:hypothetical protein